MVVFFTGHRPDKLGGYNEDNPTTQWVKNALRSVILKLIEKGATKFICGGAQGVDTWAAEICLELRDSGHSIRVMIARPYDSHGIGDGNWPIKAKVRYENIIIRADEVVIVTPGTYARYKMDLRNRYMVNNADVGVCVWNGTPGGTKNCIDYAKLRSKRLCFINPDTQEITYNWMT